MHGKRKDKKAQPKERRPREEPKSEPQTPNQTTSTRQIPVSLTKKRKEGLKRDIRSFFKQDPTDSNLATIPDPTNQLGKKLLRNKISQRERGSHPVGAIATRKLIKNYMLTKPHHLRQKRQKMYHRETSMSNEETSPVLATKRHLGSADFDRSIEIQSKSSRKIKQTRDLAFQVNSMNHIPLGLEKDSKLKQAAKPNAGYPLGRQPWKQKYNPSLNKYLKLLQRKRPNNSYSQVRGSTNTSLGLYEPNGAQKKLFQNTSGSINFTDSLGKKDLFKAASRKVSKNQSLSGIEGNILKYGNKKLGGARMKQKMHLKPRTTFQPNNSNKHKTKNKGSSRSIVGSLQKSTRLNKKARKKTGNKKERFTPNEISGRRTRGHREVEGKFKYKKLHTQPQIYNDKHLRNEPNFGDDLGLLDQEYELYSYHRQGENRANPNVYMMDQGGAYGPKQQMYNQIQHERNIEYLARRYEKNLKLREYENREMEEQMKAERVYRHTDRPNRYK